MIIPAVKHRTF